MPIDFKKLKKGLPTTTGRVRPGDEAVSNIPFIGAGASERLAGEDSTRAAGQSAGMWSDLGAAIPTLDPTESRGVRAGLNPLGDALGSKLFGGDFRERVLERLREQAGGDAGSTSAGAARSMRNADPSQVQDVYNQIADIGGAPSRAFDATYGQVAQHPGQEGLHQDFSKYSDPTLANVHADPALMATQQAALDGFMQDARDGGLQSLRAQAQFEEMNNQRSNRAMQDAVLQNMEQRGMQGSGTALMGRLSASQGLNQARAAQSLGREAQGFQNRQQALTSGADLSSRMRDTGFAEGTQRSKATDMTNIANTDLGNQDIDRRKGTKLDIFNMQERALRGMSGGLTNIQNDATNRATNAATEKNQLIGGLSLLGREALK